MSEKEVCGNDTEFLFHQGTNYYAYDYLGATYIECDNLHRYTFRVWAPNADSISLVSDFFGWDKPYPLNKVSKGVWETVFESERSLDGSNYKFKITRNGISHLKGDPYAKYSKGGADGASVIFHSNFTWSDEKWLSARKENGKYSDSYLSKPINIYEIHLGSFMRSNGSEYLNYRELGDILAPYLRYMGYTHVEIMPIAEYPYDASWGYQVGAFFAPTSRYGTPDDLRYMINKLHCEGIGVIFDWVPAHFPKDEWGLFEFDGLPLYEYQGLDRQESKTWGTRFFDIGREEVQSFLVSNALYYFREFHVDGLRVDAVASMLYLDYDKSPGAWIKNEHGGIENLEAIAFFQKLNCRVFWEFPEALMIAEESGDFGKITHPVSSGGLGFNLKWNMGWANDFYDYLACDPYFRRYKHSALTFPLMYAFSENYILPISHDEVVHGKGSLINKCYGEYEEKFQEVRIALLLMMTYPGKKHLFMGTEFGQFSEWNYKESLEWFMLNFENHYALREYVAALNRFYLKNEELWSYDFSEKGFRWLICDEADKNLVAFERCGKENRLVVIINFSGSEQSVKIRLSDKSPLKLVFSSENQDNNEILPISSDSFGSYIEPTLSAFSGGIYKADKIKKKIV